MSTGGNPYFFQSVRPGQSITADWANSLVAKIASLEGQISALQTALRDSLYHRLDAVVELTNDLSMGGSANAKVLRRDGDLNTWKDAATREITVYDAVGNIEAKAGERFIARYLKQQGIWVVLGGTGGQSSPGSSSSSSVSEWPQVIVFQLDEALSDVDETVPARGHFWSGNADNPIEITGITLMNPLVGDFGFSGPEDAGGVAVYSGTPGFYIIFNMECP